MRSARASASAESTACSVTRSRRSSLHTTGRSSPAPPQATSAATRATTNTTAGTTTTGQTPAAAATSAAPAAQPTQGGTLTIGLDQEPPTLDPGASPSAITFYITASAAESLLYLT